MHEVLSPSRTIETVELLRGRAAQVAEIEKALFSPGRHVFIYGHRGVGKSSLARTVAYAHQSSDAEPIIVQCGPNAKCFETVAEIANTAIPTDPRVRKRIVEKAGSVALQGLSLSVRQQFEMGEVQCPRSLNECIRLLSAVARLHSQSPIVVIDEFNQVEDKAEQLQFANVAKGLSDDHVPLALIFCGIGGSPEDLFAANPSAYRNFHTVHLDRLPWPGRLEIIDAAAKHLGIDIDSTSSYRIGSVSDGFPHFVHLICEKLFWRVFESDDRSRVRPQLFEGAISDCVSAMQPELRKPYELATKKYSNDVEPILWAVADGDELQRPSRDVFTSYQRIMASLGKEPLEKKVFSQRMNALKRASHGKILEGTRQGWYEFSEKMMRGYARLRALEAAVVLEREHPLEARRHGGLHSMFDERV